MGTAPLQLRTDSGVPVILKENWTQFEYHTSKKFFDFICL